MTIEKSFREGLELGKPLGKHHAEFTEQGLDIARGIVEVINQRGGKAWLGVAWEDFGADSSWETILAESQKEHTQGMIFQLLYPVEFDQMNDGTLTFTKAYEIMERAL